MLIGRPMRNIIVIIAAVIGVAGGVGYFLMRGKIDPKDADQKIKDALDKNVALVKSVDCPTADRKKGSKFNCDVEFTSGQKFRLGVEITGDDGEWRPNPPIAAPDKMSADIVATLGVKDLKVDCGKDVFWIPPDGYLCSATAGGTSGHIRVKYDAATNRPIYKPE